MVLFANPRNGITEAILAIAMQYENCPYPSVPSNDAIKIQKTPEILVAIEFEVPTAARSLNLLIFPLKSSKFYHLLMYLKWLKDYYLSILYDPGNPIMIFKLSHKKFQ